jgi:hypothetical protein
MKETDDRNVKSLRSEPEERTIAEEPMTREQASYMRSLGESGGPFPDEITQSEGQRPDEESDPS